uniref:Early endosome antigen 1 n=1 Tax=Schistosoma haematobium TaxID=6185 RepID=A0A094ZII8_SCHHA
MSALCFAVKTVSFHLFLPQNDIKKSLSKDNRNDDSDKFNSYENLVEELSTHNLNLLNRISDLEAVIHLFLNEPPLVNPLTIKDDELRQKVISFLDYQTQLVQSYSSTKPAEEDLKEKDETIDLLKKQLDELQTKTELSSVKHELNNITIKFNEFNDSKKAELNKYETELTNRSTQLSILERQLKELKLMNKKLTEDSSILIHSNENIQSELKTIKSELDIQQKQYGNNINRLTDELTESKNLNSTLQAKCHQLQIEADDAVKSNQICQEKLISLEKNLESIRSESQIYLYNSHHCRNCGGIFCQNCSSNRASTTFSKDPVRVCQMCYEELTSNAIN